MSAVTVHMKRTLVVALTMALTACGGRSDVPGPDWTLGEMQDFWAEMWSGMTPADKQSLCGAASDGRLESAMLDQPDANYASIYGYLGFLQIHCEQEGWL